MVTASTFITTQVTLRDGIKLTVDHFAVPKNERLPVILELTPYGRGPASINFRYEAPYWYKHGYIFVIGDCRGTGDSEGEMMFFSREGEDGYDLVEWIAQQPWSNGRVAMRGSSYTGTNQWFVAKLQPPHLSCITPSATIGRPMEDIPYLNGALGLNWALSWVGQAVNTPRPTPISPPQPNATSWLTHRPLRTMDVYATGRELSLYRTFLDHPTYDDYWRAMDFNQTDFEKITIPALSFTGWFDGTMHGTIWRFQDARRYAPRRADQFLIVGPYTHLNAADGGYDFSTGAPMLTVGDLPVPLNALLPGLNMTREFFDWCMKGNARPNWPPVRIFITGSDRWMARDTLPPPEVRERSLYLNSDGRANSLNGNGRLQWELPATSTSDQYLYDPNHPLIVQDYKKALAFPVDINPLLARDDVLVYTTAPITQSITVVGEIVVELKISSSATDTDFVIQLMDVFPDGTSIKLGSKTANQLRARYRQGYDREIVMVPGQSYVLRIGLHEIGHTFLPEHRIRLAVTSSFYPWVSANPNTGGPIATDTQTPIVANQTIYYGTSEPSRLIIMAVDNPVFDP